MERYRQRPGFFWGTAFAACALTTAFPDVVGAQDAPEIARQLGDVVPDDLIRLPNHHAYAQIMIDGEKSRAFSMQTWPPAMA